MRFCADLANTLRQPPAHIQRRRYAENRAPATWTFQGFLGDVVARFLKFNHLVMETTRRVNTASAAQDFKMRLKEPLYQAMTSDDWRRTQARTTKLARQGLANMCLTTGVINYWEECQPIHHPANHTTAKAEELDAQDR